MAALTSAQAEVLIVPSLKNFGKKVNAGVKATRVDPIRVQVQVDKKSLAEAEKAAREASERVGKSRDAESAAAERLRVAEARLAEQRGKSAAGSSKLVAAEASVEKARRASVSASRAAMKAAQDEEGALKRVAAARSQLDKSLARDRQFRITVDTGQL